MTRTIFAAVLILTFAMGWLAGMWMGDRLLN